MLELLIMFYFIFIFLVFLLWYFISHLSFYSDLNNYLKKNNEKEMGFIEYNVIGIFKIIQLRTLKSYEGDKDMENAMKAFFLPFKFIFYSLLIGILMISLQAFYYLESKFEISLIIGFFLFLIFILMFLSKLSSNKYKEKSKEAKREIEAEIEKLKNKSYEN